MNPDRLSDLERRVVQLENLVMHLAHEVAERLTGKINQLAAQVQHLKDGTTP